MSTKRKGKQGGGIDIFSFVKRSEIPQEVRDHFSLSLRLYREALLAKEGDMKMWNDLAGMINVGGIRAQELREQEWVEELNRGALALNAVMARHDRVGGRIAASMEEANGISIALDCLEYNVWGSMSMEDFIRIAIIIDEQNKHLLRLL